MQRRDCYNKFFPEYYEGWLAPRMGPTPYRVLNDPEIIKRKNAMREALREECIRKSYDPYRHASGVGGMVIDPVKMRWESMFRTAPEFYRIGPKLVFCMLSITILIPVMFHYPLKNNYMRFNDDCRRGKVPYRKRHALLI